MWKSFDGGKSWTKMQVIRQINDPCFFVDPVYGRCVMDGFAGARTDLSAIPSVDIANGAPTGVGATNEIVDAWADGGSNVNDNKALVSWSTDGGTTWSNPLTASLAGDRPLYAAPAIAPGGNRVYLIYEADTAPWRGADMTSPRPYHGVFMTAPIGGGGTPGRGRPATSAPDGDTPRDLSRSRHLPGADRRLRLRRRNGHLRPRGLDRCARRAGLSRGPGLPRCLPRGR